MKIALVVIYLILSLAGLVLMKYGGNPGTFSLAGGSFSVSMSLISAIGFVCYICSFLLFTRIVVMFDLSYIMPLVTGIIQILTLVAAAIVFKEKFTVQSVIGAALIIIGIVVMNYKK